MMRPHLARSANRRLVSVLQEPAAEMNALETDVLWIDSQVSAPEIAPQNVVDSVKHAMKQSTRSMFRGGIGSNNVCFVE